MIGRLVRAGFLFFANFVVLSVPGLLEMDVLTRINF